MIIGSTDEKRDQCAFYVYGDTNSNSLQLLHVYTYRRCLEDVWAFTRDGPVTGPNETHQSPDPQGDLTRNLAMQLACWTRLRDEQKMKLK